MAEHDEHGRLGRPPDEPTAFLRHVMEARGLDSTELAERVGCHRCHLNKILAGKAMPRRELAVRLADALGIDPRDVWWPESAGE